MSGVLAFLGYAAGQSLKRGRYGGHYSHYPYPQHQGILHHQPQLHPRAAPTVTEERKTKEFLIHKGNKNVGRGWFYVRK